MRDNRTKRIMRSGGLALGVSVTVPDPFVTEVMGGAGFDFVLIDAEHSPIAIDQLQIMLIALRSSESTVLVRPAANDPALIKQILLGQNETEIKMILTTPFCPYAGSMIQQVKEQAESVVEHDVKVTLLAERWDPREAGLMW